MRKTLIVLGCMSLGLAHAQQGREHTQHNGATKRVGINTEKPVATLELSKVSGVPTTQVQGFLLPHLDQAERNAMEKEALTNGLMIFNTTKNCIDWWDGAHWHCTDGRFQDEHGDDFNPVKSFTGTYTHPITSQDFTRNNCVAPQTGTTVSYTSQAITKTYVSNISQEDANEQAKQQALAEFNRLGQEYARANGACKTTFQAPACASTISGSYGVIKETNTQDLIYVGKVTFPLSPTDANLLDSLEKGTYIIASSSRITTADTGSNDHLWLGRSGNIGYGNKNWEGALRLVASYMGDEENRLSQGAQLKYNGQSKLDTWISEPKCYNKWTVQ